jgi:16S rRNA (guanine527-N7)-methyltransferase
MNLTRITDPREAAIKHVYDSLAPWQRFQHAKRILDAGSGAGFPGIPLALILPDTRFCLAESIQKKARFLDSAVESLELSNVHVYPERAERLLETQRPDVITARAVAPVSRILDLFGKYLKNGARMLLYKGPDVGDELAELPKHRLHAQVVCRYELPEGLGVRTLLEVRAQSAKH